MIPSTYIMGLPLECISNVGWFHEELTPSASVSNDTLLFIRAQFSLPQAQRAWDSIRATFTSPTVSASGEPIAACELSLSAWSAPLRSEEAQIAGDSKVDYGGAVVCGWPLDWAQIHYSSRTHEMFCLKIKQKNKLHMFSFTQAGVVYYVWRSYSLLSRQTSDNPTGLNSGLSCPLGLLPHHCILAEPTYCVLQHRRDVL